MMLPMYALQPWRTFTWATRAMSLYCLFRRGTWQHADFGFNTDELTKTEFICPPSRY